MTALATTTTFNWTCGCAWMAIRARADGALPFFTPLRMAGQCFDDETGLHDNRYRHFDPSIGRYLSPEPMLQSPKWVMGQAVDGFSVASYTYARNNPLQFTDPDGLEIPVDPQALRRQVNLICERCFNTDRLKTDLQFLKGASGNIASWQCEVPDACDLQDPEAKAKHSLHGGTMGGSVGVTEDELKTALRGAAKCAGLAAPRVCPGDPACNR